MIEMGRLCFELGNRHLSLKIDDDCVCVPYDHPTFEYLLKLGFNAEKLLANSCLSRNAKRTEHRTIVTLKNTHIRIRTKFLILIKYGN